MPARPTVTDGCVSPTLRTGGSVTFSAYLPEAAFDALPGELYVVRVAGNLADDAVLDSARYAGHRADYNVSLSAGDVVAFTGGTATAKMLRSHKNVLAHAVHTLKKELPGAGNTPKVPSDGDDTVNTLTGKASVDGGTGATSTSACSSASSRPSAIVPAGASITTVPVSTGTRSGHARRIEPSKPRTGIRRRSARPRARCSTIFTSSLRQPPAIRRSLPKKHLSVPGSTLCRWDLTPAALVW